MFSYLNIIHSVSSSVRTFCLIDFCFALVCVQPFPDESTSLTSLFLNQSLEQSVSALFGIILNGQINHACLYKQISSGCVNKCDVCYELRVTLSAHKPQLGLIITRVEIHTIHTPTTVQISSECVSAEVLRTHEVSPWQQLNTIFKLLLNTSSLGSHSLHVFNLGKHGWH